MAGSRAHLWRLGARVIAALVLAPTVLLPAAATPASAQLTDVSITPSSGPAGTAVTVAGTACRKRGSEPAQVQILAPTLGVDVVVPVDANGSWSTTFTAPSGRAEGDHTISMTCVRASGSDAYAPVTFTLTAPPAPTPTTEPPPTTAPPATTTPGGGGTAPPASTTPGTTPNVTTAALGPGSTPETTAGRPGTQSTAERAGPNGPAAAPSTEAARTATAPATSEGEPAGTTTIAVTEPSDTQLDPPSQSGGAEAPWIAAVGLTFAVPAAGWHLLRRRLRVRSRRGSGTPVPRAGAPAMVAGAAEAVVASTAAPAAAAATGSLVAPCDRPELTLVDIGAEVRALAPRIHTAAGPAVSVQLEVDPHPCVTRLGPGDLELLVLPVVDNAAHALASHGTIRIATGRGPFAPAGQIVGDADWALVVVADTGPGIPAEVLAELRETFASGGEPDAASALALVHRIVRDLGGHVDVSSVVGIGTTVTIALPLVDAAAELETTPRQ